MSKERQGQTGLESDHFVRKAGHGEGPGCGSTSALAASFASEGIQ